MAQKQVRAKHPIKFQCYKSALNIVLLPTHTIAYKYSIQIEMQNGRQKTRVQDLSIIQCNSSHQPMFCRLPCPDIMINNIIAMGLPPFVLSTNGQESSATPIDAKNEQEKYCKIREQILMYNRKQKSLSELTKKFIQRFQGANNSILVLDQVTQQMGVQRRRIYDIINIMESLNVVGKIKKNMYEWKGLKQAIETIQNLENQSSVKKIQKNKKQRSLQCLASEFLKVFSTKRQVMTLENASMEIVTDDSQQFKKTKVRRLYDIVNVFKCIGLVDKLKIQGSKPGYLWLGCQNLIKIIETKNANISPISRTQTTASKTDLQCPQLKEQLEMETPYNQGQKQNIKQLDNKIILVPKPINKINKKVKKSNKETKEARLKHNSAILFQILQEKKRGGQKIKKIKRRDLTEVRSFTLCKQSKLIKTMPGARQNSKQILREDCEDLQQQGKQMEDEFSSSSSYSSSLPPSVSSSEKLTPPSPSFQVQNNNNLREVLIVQQNAIVQNNEQSSYSSYSDSEEELNINAQQQKQAINSLKLGTDSLLNTMIETYRAEGMTTFNQIYLRFKQNLWEPCPRNTVQPTIGFSTFSSSSDGVKLRLQTNIQKICESQNKNCQPDQ